jgi:cobalt/nickel transport system ATP-binding protein
MEEIISIKNVSYSYYGKIPALRDITLSAGSGEMLSIIGTNGSGKSTLLHIINALIHPDSGVVSYKGTPLTEKTLRGKEFSISFRKSMGYIFQNPDIQLFCPTVTDELLFGPMQLNIPRDEALKRAEQVMVSLGISHLKERSVLMLSGGEKKKVAIASCLTMNPEVILIDEPLSSLDPKTQMFVTDLLGELCRAGKTVIFTTHQLDLIEYLQPRVALLSEDHTIIKTGTAAEILEDKELLSDSGLLNSHLNRFPC